MSIFASNPNDVFGSRAQEQFAALARSQKGNTSNTLNQNVNSKSVQQASRFAINMSPATIIKG